MSTTSYRLALAATVLGAALASALWLIPSPAPWTVRYVGAATGFLSLTPGLLYLATPRSVRRPIPFLPIVGLIYGIYFGFPFAFWILPDPADPHRLLDPALLALGGWLALLWAYWLFGHVFRPIPWDLSRFVDADVLAKAGFMLIGVGLLQELAQYAVTLPLLVGGIVTLLRGLGWVGAGFLVAAWSSGSLTGRQKLLALAGIALISILEIATGSVSNPAQLWLLLLIAAWIGYGRRSPIGWWAFATAALVVLMVLRGAAIEYRKLTWYGAQLSPIERSATYFSIVSGTLTNRGIRGSLRQSAQVVGERMTQGTVLADVVARTPGEVPYWNGQTYFSLVGALVPRFIWPSKPMKTLGQEFGHRYSYLDPWDRTTSYNFPFLVEFYANFGPLGVFLGMTLVGLLYRLLDDLLNRGRKSAGVVGSILALGLMIPLMIGLESDFSLVFGGLILNGVALYIVLRVLTQPIGSLHRVRNFTAP